ncbi:XisI protein [Scytonema sp. UIC 10036]|uniref:XisI protein n=1 Tax=Scytonema sp. UIC 10036 TaxID=2304196 RepID=UPI0012DA5FA0|nr:XisI protein [Scytonema sp. UIC 10036]MUG95959.1 XisI protein [Scytonema sp. UIC 10036]
MAVEQYRQIIQQLILERAQRRLAQQEIETQAVLDTARDHYLLLHTGWRGNNRTHGCSMHLDIKDGKIWIQHDGTEVGIATLLLEHGVPKEDIVLGFHSPYMRQFTEFATQ